MISKLRIEIPYQLWLKRDYKVFSTALSLSLTKLHTWCGNFTICIFGYTFSQ